MHLAAQNAIEDRIQSHNGIWIGLMVSLGAGVAFGLVALGLEPSGR